MALEMLATSIKPTAHRKQFVDALGSHFPSVSFLVLCSHFKHIAVMPRSTPRSHLILNSGRRKRDIFFKEQTDKRTSKLRSRRPISPAEQNPTKLGGRSTRAHLYPYTLHKFISLESHILEE